MKMARIIPLPVKVPVAVKVIGGRHRPQRPGRRRLQLTGKAGIHLQLPPKPHGVLAQPLGGRLGAAAAQMRLIGRSERQCVSESHFSAVVGRYADDGPFCAEASLLFAFAAPHLLDHDAVVGLCVGLRTANCDLSVGKPSSAAN